VAGAASTDVTHTQGPDAGHAAIPPLDSRPWNYAVVVEENTNPKQVATRNMAIEFDRCIVNLRRNWISDGFLALKNWYVPGFKRGDFSKGPPLAENVGLFSSIPIGCVLTKDVRIQATWTPEDVEALDKSLSAGPFSLLGRSFDSASGVIRVPGVQAMAWICSSPAVLPPDDDPGL
jgi:hypothetical protein